MKRIVMAALAVLVLGGCGYSRRDAEMIGQVKKITRVTPIVCPDYIEADVSLGVLRNGVGSMSTQDIDVRVMNARDEALLKYAAETGQLVKIRYDQRRITWCYPEEQATWVELVQ